MDFVSAFGDKWHMSAPSDTAPSSHMVPAIAAVIVAAGSGSRMQGTEPKQFLALCGKPVLCHSVDVFASHAAVVEIVIVGPSDDLASVGRALGTIGDAGVSIMTMAMGAALFYKPPPPPLPEMPPRRQTSDGPQEVALQPESPTAAVGEKAYNTYKFSPRKASNVTTREIFAMCILKLVLIPAVGFAFTWLAMKYGMFGSKPLDGLRALVVCLEWAVPSAQTCIVVMVTLQHHELAKNMAVLYLFMYPLSMISLTAWTSFALYLVEQHIWDSR